MLTKPGQERLIKLNYSPAPMESMHLGIVDVSLGKLGAMTGYHVDAHDAFIPFSFAQNYGVLPYDIDGKKIRKIRLERAAKGYKPISTIFYFANDEIRDELLPVFQNAKNVNK